MHNPGPYCILGFIFRILSFYKYLKRDRKEKRKREGRKEGGKRGGREKGIPFIKWKKKTPKTK
jgi:hypothetical protein